MIVQYYDNGDNEPVGRVFDGDVWVCDISAEASAEGFGPQMVDDSLRRLGWRRREAWKPKEWGCEASLRRISTRRRT